MPSDARQVMLKKRQMTGHAAGAEPDTEQVFVQSLVQRPAARVGIQREALVAARGLRETAGVMMIGQHQAQAAQMGHITVVQPRGFPPFRVLLHAPGHSRDFPTPALAGKWRVFRESPAGPFLFFRGLVVDTIPAWTDLVG